jgi:hypothetical protein
MKRWQALVGIGLLIALARLALGGAGKHNVLTESTSARPIFALDYFA